MTDIKQKALALLNEARAKLGFPPFDRCDPSFYAVEALCRAIEEHEAYKQEVSDAVEDIAKRREAQWLAAALDRFIVAKPDPLVEALEATGDDEAEERAWRLRTQLAARGLEIRETNHD